MLGRPLPDQDERGFRALLALAVVLPLVAAAGAAWYDRAVVRQAEARRVAATADAVAGQTQAVMETSVLALELLADRVQAVPIWDLRQGAGFHQFLLSLTARLPQLESAFVVSADGHIVASSRQLPMPAFDVGQRDYYRQGRAPAGRLFVSEPFRGMTTGGVSFVVTQALPGGGEVGVTLSTAFFRHYDADLLIRGHDDLVALVRNDGVFLLRTPDLGAGAATRVQNQDTLAALATGRTATFIARSPQDGQRRLVALRQLHGLPMTVIFASAAAALLVPWHHHVVILTVVALLMSALLGAATWAAMQRARGERQGLRRLLAETERREQAEAALRQAQKMEALGRLTGGVAHDFNNLLTAIMGSVELAARRTSDAAIVRLLHAALEAAQRGARLTRQMLAFSRQQQPLVQPVDLAALVEGARDLLARTLGRDIDIACELPPGLWWVRAEPTQLDMALLNLAINARDAMPGGGSLRFSAANVPGGDPRPPGVPAGELVQLAIGDTGGGMSEEVRRRATEPFFTTKQVGRGTGLGLSMVDGMLRQCGGALQIESAPGAGTTITLYLPRAEPQAVAAPDEAASATPSRPLRVLLVDDNAAVRSTTAAMLGELGHAVTEAADGATALRSAAACAPDVALVDFAMPEMDGDALAAALSANHPGLPIVLLTGYADRAAGDSGWEGFAGKLVKPCSLDDLARALQSAMRLLPQAV